MTSRTATQDESPSSVEGTRDEPTSRLLADELTVAKEQVETGRVRISTRTHEREGLVDENLACEPKLFRGFANRRGSRGSKATAHTGCTSDAFRPRNGFPKQLTGMLRFPRSEP